MRKIYNSGGKSILSFLCLIIIHHIKLMPIRKPFRGRMMQVSTRIHTLYAICCAVLFAGDLDTAVAQSGRMLFGEVRSVDGLAIPRATVSLKGVGLESKTDTAGKFHIQVPESSGFLVVTHMGYKSAEVKYHPETKHLLISLVPQDYVIEEVEVNTGYFQLPKERLTGSFTVLDEKLLDRSPAMNILERMEGLASSVQFNRKDAYNERMDNTNIRVRGVSSINSSSAPLIILDDFPYEGDISSINPESIASITLLKDAAASSIWGARAGNGVIVITTKKGAFNSRQSTSFSSRVLFTEKPDMFYYKNRLPTETVLQIEDRLFQQGVYAKQDRLALPYFVDLKYQLRDGLITEEIFESELTRLKNTDVREEAMKYLYQTGIQYQHNLGFKGGSSLHRYQVNLSHAQERQTVIGDNSRRIVLDISNGFNLWKSAMLQVNMGYSDLRNQNNGITISSLHTGGVGTPSTYTQLRDDMGNNLPIVRDYNWTYVNAATSNGLLDWRYYPLSEREMTDKKSEVSFLRFAPQISYDFLKDWQIRVNYQYQQSLSSNTTHYSADSYYVRNLVNRFTQSDGKSVIPHGDIFNYGIAGQQKAQSLRVQLGYNKTWKDVHQLYALAGAERREAIFENTPATYIYNYDPELRIGTGQFDYTKLYPLRPAGNARILGSDVNTQKNIDRDISYYSNFSYSYAGRFVLTNSMRWDASNLFGVKTNQRGVPLWSIGGAWHIDQEDFLAQSIFNSLKLRATYGISGNVNKNVSTYPTIRYGTNVETKLPMATLSGVGNPSLRWEKVKTANMGLDWRIKDSFFGSIDYYHKKAEDLFGLDYVDPTTGVSGSLQQMVNYADLLTRGLDVDITAKSTFFGWTWTGNVLASIVNNKITDYSTNDNLRASSYLLTTGKTPPRLDQSVDVLYALPWHGLSATDGMPIVRIDGEETSDYNNYITNYPVAKLINVGVTVPRFHGFLRNTFAWKKLEIGGMVSWKSGYKYRRSSMAPGDEYQGNNQHHMDYFKRWQKPGDENSTVVPAMTDSYASPLAMAYQYAEVLIESANHIRLEDVVLSYDFELPVLRIPCKTSFMARNLGIVWKQSKSAEDPDYPYATYRRPLEFNMNLQIKF